MYYAELPLYAMIIWIFFGLLALLPWITIIGLAIYKFIQVWRIPKTSIAGTQ
ncbi:hypothetical protein H8E88_15900 [candidate division KSB1 bacterium]|nr:hypothetical protein [candidate division KSB1 bacterium]